MTAIFAATSDSQVWQGCTALFHHLVLRPWLTISSILLGFSSFGIQLPLHAFNNSFLQFNGPAIRLSSFTLVTDLIRIPPYLALFVVVFVISAEMVKSC